VQAWAFAWWGGDLYLFFKSGKDLSSAVWKLTGDTARSQDHRQLGLHAGRRGRVELRAQHPAVIRGLIACEFPSTSPQGRRWTATLAPKLLEFTS